MLWKRPAYRLRCAHVEMHKLEESFQGSEVIPFSWLLGRSHLEQAPLVCTMQPESCEMSADGPGYNRISSLATWKMQPEKKDGWIGLLSLKKGV